MFGATHADVVFGVKTGGPARESPYIVIRNRRLLCNSLVDGSLHNGLRFLSINDGGALADPSNLRRQSCYTVLYDCLCKWD